MKPGFMLPNPPVCAEEEIANWEPPVFRRSQTWERKMALLEEIHDEISPQLQELIAKSDDAYSHGPFDGMGLS